jgi:hypothetical protein
MVISIFFLKKYHNTKQILIIIIIIKMIKFGIYSKRSFIVLTLLCYNISAGTDHASSISFKTKIMILFSLTIQK